ncbi:MAG: glycosyltransferase family 2 protein [Steroidobacteraceae bacterium]|nr:glycosyltransferase family 2 protein [Steroidobacteraceae bacterium]
MNSSNTSAPARNLEVSVVIPVCNEQDNVLPLAREIHAALEGRYRYETIFVDDGSTDGTAAAVRAAHQDGMPEIRLIRHSVRSGQSAAVATGTREARAPWIATLDGDGQNDPGDIPNLLAAVLNTSAPHLRLVMGNRTTRRDTWLRRLSSRVANGVRGWMLKDGTPDTGCGIKVFDRAVFMDMPRFNHMHRFMPALYQREGYEVVSVPVNHRERTRGQSKYGLHNRLWVGIVDLFGVMWLIRRASPRIRIDEDA